MARALKAELPDVPIIVGGVFATMNQERLLRDCQDFDPVGIGEGEELLARQLSRVPGCSLAQ